MNNVISTIEKLIKEKPDTLIAIDGPCASGKTTLAMLIAEKFGAQIIHMDDFFLPPEMRTAERLSQAGGNVHYERFNAQVVKGIESGKEFVYGVYSCSSGTTAQSKPVSPDKPIVIEGSYALHPQISTRYDVKIFVESDYETRLERILQRNGADALEIFKSKWIPMENRYFQEFNGREKCDIIVKTDRKA